MAVKGYATAEVETFKGQYHDIDSQGMMEQQWYLLSAE